MTPTIAFSLLSVMLFVPLAKLGITMAVAARSDRETEQLRTYLGWKPAEAGN